MARQMKESGIDWIGRIPNEWHLAQLKRFVTVNNGREILEEIDKSDDAIPVYGSGGIFKYTSSYLYDGIAVLFGRKGTLGKPIMTNGKIWVVDTMYYLTYSPELDPKFNYFQLQCFDWVPHITQTALPSIVASEIVSCSFAFPPLWEQKKIASFLEAELAKIDIVQRNTRFAIDEYKRLKQSIIAEAVTKGIHNIELKDTEYEWIGKIPLHWKTIKIKWLLNERKEHSEEGSEEPLSMSQKLGLIPTKEMDMVPNMASSFVGAKLVHVGDLVFNKLKAHLGVFAVSKYEGLVSPDYAVYYSTGLANMKYLEYLFKTPQYIGEFRKKSTGVGAGLTRLYTGDLFSIYCSFPPIQEQQEIVNFINMKCREIDTLISKKTALLGELENYKKSIIYEYVTGKKEVQ